MKLERKRVMPIACFFFGAAVLAVGAWAELIELNTAHRLAHAAELDAQRTRAYWPESVERETVKIAPPPSVLPAGIEDAMRATVRIEAFYPAIVRLRLLKIDGERMTWFRHLFAPTPPKAGEFAGVGTGFVIGPGLVMSAAHVISDDWGAENYRITLADGRTVEAGRIERSSKYDAAIVHVPGLAIPGLQIADRMPPVGAPLGVIGMPTGMAWAITTGRAEGLELFPGQDGHGEAQRLKVAIVSRGGNSGGPVLDTSGHVVGVFSHSNRANRGWAMPAAAALADIHQHPGELACLPTGEGA